MNIKNELICFGKFIYYNIECFRRSKIDYFQYEALSKPFYLHSYHNYLSTFFYGIHRALKNKFNIKRIPTNYIIEHGVYFEDSINEVELAYCKNPCFITMGQQRLEFLHQHGVRNVTSVGPYILYANHFKTEQELAALKKRLGRVLLVFPSHSIENVTAVFEKRDLIKEIENLRVNYDTVIICIYFKDIQEKRYKDYEGKGYIIASAGHRCDPHFLSRLKDLIYLSDMTMSNSLGTHIGYSVSMGKPHYMYKQKTHYQGTGLQEEQQYSDLDVLSERTALFQSLFGVYKEEITNEQIKAVKYYWGDFPTLN